MVQIPSSGIGNSMEAKIRPDQGPIPSLSTKQDKSIIYSVDKDERERERERELPSYV
jgi:hypothetical protein